MVELIVKHAKNLLHLNLNVDIHLEALLRSVGDRARRVRNSFHIKTKILKFEVLSEFQK